MNLSNLAIIALATCPAIPLFYRGSMAGLVCRNVVSIADAFRAKMLEVGKADDPSLVEIHDFILTSAAFCPRIATRRIIILRRPERQYKISSTFMSVIEDDPWVTRYVMAAITTIDLLAFYEQPWNPLAAMRSLRALHILKRYGDPDRGINLVKLRSQGAEEIASLREFAKKEQLQGLFDLTDVAHQA